jgi:MFS family permease
VFAAAAVGAGLVRTVTTTYLPLLLADISEAPALIGLVMMVNSAVGFAVPLLVEGWSDRRHTSRQARRPFIAGGSLVAACGLKAAALGHDTSFLVLTLAGAVAYVGVNVVTTAHRALVHDRFEGEQYARGNGAVEVAMLTVGLLGLAVCGLLTGVASWAPFVLAAVGMPLRRVAGGTWTIDARARSERAARVAVRVNPGSRDGKAGSLAGLPS